MLGQGGGGERRAGWSEWSAESGGGRAEDLGRSSGPESTLKKKKYYEIINLFAMGVLTSLSPSLTLLSLMKAKLLTAAFL